MKNNNSNMNTDQQIKDFLFNSLSEQQVQVLTNYFIGREKDKDVIGYIGAIQAEVELIYGVYSKPIGTEWTLRDECED